jgi:hypothetical protein
MNQEKLDFINRLKLWIKLNALDETTHSNICDVNGVIKFKKSEIEKKGIWTQDEWNEKIKNFRPSYIYYSDLLEFIDEDIMLENVLKDKGSIKCTCPDCKCDTTVQCLHSNDNNGCGCKTCMTDFDGDDEGMIYHKREYHIKNGGE